MARPRADSDVGMDGHLPTFDLAEYWKLKEAGDAAGLDAMCRQVAECLANTSTLIVRDPRVPKEDNDNFQGMMQRYFGQEREKKLAQARPNLHYQVGCTPDGVEVPRCKADTSCLSMIEGMAPQHRPRVPTGADPKWRYMWRVGPRPSSTKFAELNAEPVVPPEFGSAWSETMDAWGAKMLAATEAAAEMLAAGFGLEPGAFTGLMANAPHLLAPTGSDLASHGDLDTIFAGFHYDLNFLTIHGKSSFPGLFIWLRDGTRVPVKVPDGCLLIQAGKQMEWLTGGAVKAGWHEVVVSEATKQVAAERAAAGQSLWRVSSTVFSHIASDAALEPLGAFATPEARKAYPATLAGDQVSDELKMINLASGAEVAA